VTSFEFYRFRFHFRGIDAVHFPPGKGGNAVRGALGLALRKAGDPSVYARLFEPAGKSPGGLADWPRPFVLRAAHLDGLTVPPGGRFHLDIHVFDVREPSLDIFRAAFAAMGSSGLGAGRGRAELERVEQLDLDDRAAIAADVPGTPSVVTLDACGTPVERVSVRFVTPTELKAGGELAARPEFPILFSRVRDRLSTLRALYGAGPLEIDFRAMGERAGLVRMLRCDLEWDRTERRSGRTGQVHSIGGFTGEAEYQGSLAEFLPWLRAARWVGVGRQTVWGKGEVRVFAVE